MPHSNRTDGSVVDLARIQPVMKVRHSPWERLNVRRRLKKPWSGTRCPRHTGGEEQRLTRLPQQKHKAGKNQRRGNSRFNKTARSNIQTSVNQQETSNDGLLGLLHP